MTIRYRGFQIFGSNPFERPMHLAVYDPMRPGEELATFTDGESIDQVFGEARVYIDGLCAAEVELATGGLVIP